MCGIAGVFDRDCVDRPERIARMLAAMEHRGPDASGVFVEGDVILGHRRLAVLDLSPAGSQPMTDTSGRYVCTYNGTIYNYIELREVLQGKGFSFRSTGDTEVLLAAFVHWGASCLHRFNGMFAFAIYDRWSRTLFCARDRLGVKPFVYSSTPRGFAFASEHKALVSGGLAEKRMSPEAVYEFIARGYLTEGRSFFADIQVLPPGGALIAGPRGVERLWEWWSPDLARITAGGGSASQRSEALRNVLEDAVRLRLRADVPIAAHLSGGLDSSAVVAAAVRQPGTDITTFTGAFPGVGHADERQYSRAVADSLGMHRVEVEMGLDDLAGVFRRVVWHLDEPVAGPGVLPQQLVYDATAAHRLKVVLGGHGGDELFGGYLRHRALHFKRVLTSSSNVVVRMAAAVELVRMIFREGRRLRRTAIRVPDESLDADFVASVDPALRTEVRLNPLRFATAEQSMRWDLQYYLPALLQAEDRVSMASSVESRAPLLDYRLVELALSVPEDWHFSRGVTKPFLRDAVSLWLPSTVAGRTDKRGFPTPLEHWTGRPALRRIVGDVLASSGAAGPGDLPPIFSSSYLARPEQMHPGQLWTVLSIQAWRQTPTGAGRRRAGSRTATKTRFPSERS